MSMAGAAPPPEGGIRGGLIEGLRVMETHANAPSLLKDGAKRDVVMTEALQQLQFPSTGDRPVAAMHV